MFSLSLSSSFYVYPIHPLTKQSQMNRPQNKIFSLLYPGLDFFCLILLLCSSSILSFYNSISEFTSHCWSGVPLFSSLSVWANFLHYSSSCATRRPDHQSSSPVVSKIGTGEFFCQLRKYNSGWSGAEATNRDGLLFKCWWLHEDWGVGEYCKSPLFCVLLANSLQSALNHWCSVFSCCCFVRRMAWTWTWLIVPCAWIKKWHFLYFDSVFVVDLFLR